jgi:hypothetical protein
VVVVSVDSVVVVVLVYDVLVLLMIISVLIVLVEVVVLVEVLFEGTVRDVVVVRLAIYEVCVRVVVTTLSWKV